MKPHVSATPCTHPACLFGLIVLLACCVTATAQAQPTQQTGNADSLAAIVPEGAAMWAMSAPSDADPEAWNHFVQDQARLLGSSDRHLKEQALQNVIFVAKVYSDKVDLSPTVPGLLDIYRFDRNEDHRIMALSALHPIGNKEAMEFLRRHVREVKSDRVRTLTCAVLAEFFGRENL